MSIRQSSPDFRLAHQIHLTTEDTEVTEKGRDFCSFLLSSVLSVFSDSKIRRVDGQTQNLTRSREGAKTGKRKNLPFFFAASRLRVRTKTLSDLSFYAAWSPVCGAWGSVVNPLLDAVTLASPDFRLTALAGGGSSTAGIRAFPSAT